MIIILYVYIYYISYLVCLVSTIPKFLLMKSPIWFYVNCCCDDDCHDIMNNTLPILLLGIPISSIWERVSNLNESSRRSENINGDYQWVLRKW